MARLKRYKLEELVDECDLTSPRSVDDEAWLDMAPVGLEFECPDSAEREAGLSEAVPSGKMADDCAIVARSHE